MKKQLFALGAASVMALGAMSGSVFATDVAGESGTSDAVYSVGKSYIVNIPGKINLSKSGNSAAGTANVSASSVLLGVGETLTVSVRTSTGKLQASSGAVTSEIPYTIAIDGGTAANATTLAGDDKYSEIFTMSAGTTSHAATSLAFATTSFDDVTLAAEHKDTLTFKVDVEEPYMQDIDDAMKAGIASGGITTLRDNRDNKDYYVAKLADNNIWMVQNLDYVPTGATWEDDGIFAGSGDIYTSGLATATGGTDKHFSQGSYYNWDAANTACPTGWELPSESQLETLISAAILTEDNVTGSPFYGVLAGSIGTDGLGRVGGSGRYWSDTETSNGAMLFNLRTGTDGSVNTTGFLKTRGYSVRCVAQ